MAYTPPAAAPRPKIETTVTESWKSGVVTALDDGRTPIDGLRSTSNTILDQDGTIRPRPSLQQWGPQPVGTVLGEIYEFRAVSGLDTTNWLITLQKITQNEVQTLTITGTPTGGTFTLTFGGQTTASIAFNASAATVQTRLTALSSIGSGNVTCAGGALPGSAVTITFTGTLANTDAALITSTSSLTGGTSPAITLTETTKGGYTTYAHIAKPEDTTWTKCTGNTFSTTAKGHFFQLNDKVIILNGSESISYLSVPTVLTTPVITPFTAIGDGTAPTVANNGTTSLVTGTTSYKIWYAVTANSTVGESTGVATSLSINTQRDNWDKTVNSLKITWSAVTSAQSYNLYCAVAADGASQPTLFQLATGLDAGTLSFVDDSSLGLANFKEMPTTNSTAGPAASRGVAINGRAWLTGDKNNPYYLWHGGDPGHELDFTPTFGGGFVKVGNGTGEIPVRVWNFRSGPGEPQIKCLTRGLNGGGKRYTISPTTLSLAGNSFTVWAPSEDYGFSGTDSPDGLIVYNNNTYYPSRDGFRTIGTKPQLQNLLSNDEVSQTIKTDLGLINNDAMDGCVGMGYLGRLYWALPVGTSSNSEIWVLDLDRNGAWMKSWTVSADWMCLVADNAGYTHHIVLSNNIIYEFSYNTKTSDDGVAFPTSGSTGLITFSKDGRQWARLIRTVAEVLRVQGRMNFAVTGYTNAKKVVPLGTGSINSTATTSGFGWSEGGWGTFGWGDFVYAPVVTALATQDANIKINKNVRYWSLSWSTTEANVDYNISKLISEFVNVGIKNLS